MASNTALNTRPQVPTRSGYLSGGECLAGATDGPGGPYSRHD